MANDDVSGYSKPIEHERGQNAAPLKAKSQAKAASYATPKRHPDPVDAGADGTGGFGGDTPMKTRSAKVQP